MARHDTKTADDMKQQGIRPTSTRDESDSGVGQGRPPDARLGRMEHQAEPRQCGEVAGGRLHVERG